MFTRASTLVDLPKHHRAYPIVAILAAIVMLVRAGLTTQTFNHTVDEPDHIGAAIGLYEAHKHIVDMTHPPLPWLLVGASLKVMGVSVPELRGVTTVMDFDHSEAVGGRVLFEQSRDYWTILTVARLTMLIFPAILFFYLYRLVSWLASPLAAMLAVVLLTTDPTILGHAALVNNDVAAGAALLAMFYHCLRWIVKRNWKTALIAGAVVGLAAGTKFTVVLLIPTLLLVMAIRVARTLWRDRRPMVARIRFALRRIPSIPQMAVAGVIAFFVLWSLYLFNVGQMNNQHFFDYTPKFQQKVPAKIRLANIPMPSLALGLLFQSIHSQNGHVAYLNGQFRGLGWKTYFPEALAIKEPVAYLAGLIAAIGGWLLMKRARRPFLAFLIGLPAAVYLYFAATSHVMIGIRHLVPAIALSCGFIAAVFVGMMRTQRIAVILLAMIALGSAVEAAARHPDYLAFFNVFVGGPKNGEKYLIDSNLDWGQDVTRLAAWIKTDPRAANRPYTLRIHDTCIKALLANVGLDPQAQAATPTGLFAISKNYRYGLLSTKGLGNDLKLDGEDFSFLKGLTPIAHIGESIDVYNLGNARFPTTSPSDGIK